MVGRGVAACEVYFIRKMKRRWITFSRSTIDLPQRPL